MQLLELLNLKDIGVSPDALANMVIYNLESSSSLEETEMLVAAVNYQSARNLFLDKLGKLEARERLNEVN